MDYGLSGNMRANVTEPRLQIGSSIEATRNTDIDDSQIGMLELEIEDLSSELEKERRKSSIERTDCTRHLQELEDAELELLRCQTAIQNSELKLEEAQVKIREKDDELLDVKKELVQYSRRVGELEYQIEKITARNQEVQSYQVKANGPFNGPTEPEKQQAHESMGQQERPNLNRRNEMLQETLEEHTRLTIQVKTLEDQVETLTRELQTSRNEVVDKTKEMDILRSYLRGSGQHKSKKERDVQETETQIEKNLRMKDSMISRYTHQIEELQVKAKRIPQLASQLSKLESLNATLKSQRAAFAEDMETSARAWEQKENGMRAHISKLEIVNAAMKSQYEKQISDMKESKAALEQKKNKAAKRTAELESENRTLAKDVKRSEDAQTALKEKIQMLEKRISYLEEVRAEHRSLLGVIFCVDMSRSLSGDPEQLAKEAFRKLISDLRSKYPKAYVGVVIHGSSVYVAHQLAEVNSHASSVLDSITSSGSENYLLAFTHVVSLLSTFKAFYPEAKRLVIIISDGEECSVPGDISVLCADGVPCHNFVIDKEYSKLDTTATERYSFMTGGKNFRYNGRYGLSDIDYLIKP